MDSRADPLATAPEAAHGNESAEMSDESRSLNTLAREAMIHRLLADIRVDLEVCKIEGWNPKEYIDRLKREIDAIYNKFEKNKQLDFGF